MNFEFATANRILFGNGQLFEIGPLLADWGRQALVVIGSSTLRAEPLLDVLRRHQIDFSLFNVVGEPTTDLVRQGAGLARRENCQFVIGLGGGSVLDSGKAIAALLTNGGDPLDYLEVIGRGQPLRQPAAPYLAIPTTAGTGAEVTRNAVLESPEHRVKVSLRSPFMLPALAVVDPELTLTLPPPLTASTGLDALTQLIEPYVSVKANPLTDALCLDGLQRAAWALGRAYADGDDLPAREDMALASLFGGLALANSKLGAVHGFAGVVGGMFDAPHGAVCAALLPAVVATNLKALRLRQPDGEALARYGEIGQILTGMAEATPEDGLVWLERLVEELNILPLRAYGLSEADFPELIDKAAASSSMQGNPLQLTREELQEILELAWER
jgi:alcohol dehydrogenase class IV